MKKRYKGAALIVSVMVITILLIVTGGIYAVITNLNIQTANNINQSKMQLAAESGLNYAVVWLKNIPNSAFCGTAAPTLATSKLIDGMTVAIKGTYKSTGKYWTLESTSALNGKKCTVKLDNLISSGSSPLSNSYFVASTSPMTVAYSRGQYWVGDLFTNQSLKLTFLRKDTNGNLHTGDETAKFYGKVYCTNAMTSQIGKYKVGSVSGTTNWEGRVLPAATFPSYSKGLDLAIDLIHSHSSDDDYTKFTDAQIGEILTNTTFKNATYETPASASPVNLVSENWATIVADSKTYTITGDATFEFLETYTGSAIPAANYINWDLGPVTPAAGFDAKITTSSGVKYYKLGLKYDKIAVDGKVTVKGMVGSSSTTASLKNITIVTKSQDIIIDGDLYSGKLKNLKDANDFGDDYDANNANLTANKLLTTSAESIGLIAGADVINSSFTPNGNGANIVISEKNKTNSNAIFINAALFAPNGSVTVQNLDNWKNYSGAIQKNAVFYGSVIKYDEQVSSKQIITGTSTGTSGFGGITPIYINSKEFKAGSLPPGFKSSSISVNTQTGSVENSLKKGDWSILWH